MKQQTKTIKNCIFNDNGGAGYYTGMLQYNYNNRHKKQPAIKGNKTKHHLFKAVFKAERKNKQFKIITRRL